MLLLSLTLIACTAHRAHPTTPTEYLPALGGLTSEVVESGPLPSRLARGDGADLVLLYGGEEKGDLGPCGCPSRPRGGVARAAAYRDAVVQSEPGTPVLTVNGGYWLEDSMGLDGTPRADVPVLNRWMVVGLTALDPSALNVGYNDMAGLTSLGAAGPPDLPLVSANVRGAGVAPYRLITVDTDSGPLRVGITGITTPGVTFLPTPGFQVSAPVAAARAVLAELGPQADLVVLLDYGAPEAARALATDPEAGRWIDIVVDTNLHHAEGEPFRVGSAIWVRSHMQTMRLGELRLGLDRAPEEEGGAVRIAWARERKIDLDDEIPDALSVSSATAAASAEIDAARSALFDQR